MMDSLLSIYHRLPTPLRSLAASVRGYQLRSWRYGPETERLIEEAVEREQWGEARWRAWQEEKLARILHRAATRVPYYREYWASRRSKGDQASWERLENWPILEKEPVRQNAQAFIAEDVDIRRMRSEQTSGTTGKPLRLWSSTETVRAWYALFEARSRHWYGVSRRNRWAMLGGQLVTPIRRRTPPFWVWNVALNQLYMSSYHLAPDLITFYLDAIKRYRIRYIYGYTSSIYSLAQEALRLGRKELHLAVVITNAEPVFGYQRDAITEAFQCPVKETYGMSEIVMAASECESESLHLWPEAGWLEVFEQGEPVPYGQMGDLVCTGLLNPDMPLIRYRVGDRGALSQTNMPCECGRTLPMLGSIEGRIDDVLYTADGRRIGRLDPVFKTSLPLREAQIIQERLDQVRVKYVPAPEFTTDAERLITERLQERMGFVKVILEQVDEVPRTSNGKFRAVISNISGTPDDCFKSAARR